ncbi:MAG: glycosyltransferase [Actinobacteria bacterium]|nr:glycosyltransferase [Actinomycetota bacterium]
MWLFRLARKLCSSFVEALEVEEGLYEPRRFLLGRGSWSSGRVVMRVKKKATLGELRLGLKNPSTTPFDSMNVRLELIEKPAGKVVVEKSLSIPRSAKEIISFFEYDNCSSETGRVKGYEDQKSNFYILISSDTFVPSSVDSKSIDARKLGVFVYNETKTGVIKKIVLKILGFVPLFLVDYPRDLKFLETYDRIVAISEFSHGWIRKLWGKDSVVLYPPVEVDDFEPGKKEKIILSVGRFFPEHHNKKQLELARVFIELLKEYPHIMNGYQLYLVGGVDQRKNHLEYVGKIESMSKDYPIKILTNVSWDNLVDIFSRAMIFWHAAGMGVDEGKEAYKLEHFGITTVEAMASGCIPVVVNKGGQKEIIKNGEDGFLFNSWEELKKITLDICGGKVDVDKIRKNAIRNCKRFSAHMFEKNLLSIIEEETNVLRSITYP